VRLDYIFKRFGLLLIVVWTAATINFVMPKLNPRNPIRERLYQMAQQGGFVEAGINELVKAYEEKFGLDQPLWKQYLRYLGDMARLDLGYSLTAFPKRVIDQIKEVVGWSIGIASVCLSLAFSVGVILGAMIGWPRSPKWLAYLVTPLMTISSVPAYIFGLVLIYFLAFRAALFPMMGGVTLGVVHANSFDYFTDVLRHAALPVITVLLVSLGGWALGMRGMMITVQGEDYMILAEAKGLKPQRIFMRYAVRNALLPLVTGLGIAMGHLVTGQILVESLFGFPGMGSLLSGSIRLNDYNIIYGITFLIILSIGVMTFLLDLAYPFIDPRIRLGGGGR
jgi:peptide/nickel transport system permease protein